MTVTVCKLPGTSCEATERNPQFWLLFWGHFISVFQESSLENVKAAYLHHREKAYQHASTYTAHTGMAILNFVPTPPAFTQHYHQLVKMYFKCFIVHYIDILLMVEAKVVWTISALGNLLYSSEPSAWLASTEDTGMYAGHWRCPSQLLHLSALLPPAPNSIHSNQRQCPCPRQSFVSYNVYRGLWFMELN